MIDIKRLFEVAKGADVVGFPGEEPLYFDAKGIRRLATLPSRFRKARAARIVPGAGAIPTHIEIRWTTGALRFYEQPPFAVVKCTAWNRRCGGFGRLKCSHGGHKIPKPRAARVGVYEVLS